MNGTAKSMGRRPGMRVENYTDVSCWVRYQKARSTVIPKARQKETVFRRGSGQVIKCYIWIIDVLDTKMISVTVSLVDDADLT